MKDVTYTINTGRFRGIKGRIIHPSRLSRYNDIIVDRLLNPRAEGLGIVVNIPKAHLTRSRVQPYADRLLKGERRI